MSREVVLKKGHYAKIGPVDGNLYFAKIEDYHQDAVNSAESIIQFRVVYNMTEREQVDFLKNLKVADVQLLSVLETFAPEEGEEIHQHLSSSSIRPVAELTVAPTTAPYEAVHEGEAREGEARDGEDDMEEDGDEEEPLDIRTFRGPEYGEKDCREKKIPLSGGFFQNINILLENKPHEIFDVAEQAVDEYGHQLIPFISKKACFNLLNTKLLHIMQFEEVDVESQTVLSIEIDHKKADILYINEDYWYILKSDIPQLEEGVIYEMDLEYFKKIEKVEKSEVSYLTEISRVMDRVREEYPSILSSLSNPGYKIYLEREVKLDSVVDANLTNNWLDLIIAGYIQGADVPWDKIDFHHFKYTAMVKEIAEKKDDAKIKELLLC
jgi:hypothetical protein